MENFKVNEYFKDYVAVQREYFSDLKQVTEPIEVNGRLESQVLFNGEKYKKIEKFNDYNIYILLIPNEKLQILPVVEFKSTKKHIHIENFKLINKRALEHTSYVSLFEKDNEIDAKLETKYFDVSDEIDNVSYILEYGILTASGKEIDKKLIGSNCIVATRNSKSTTYLSKDANVYSIEPVIMPNNGTTLFELLKELDKEQQEKHKTK